MDFAACTELGHSKC